MEAAQLPTRQVLGFQRTSAALARFSSKSREADFATAQSRLLATHLSQFSVILTQVQSRVVWARSVRVADDPDTELVRFPGSDGHMLSDPNSTRINIVSITREMAVKKSAAWKQKRGVPRKPAGSKTTRNAAKRKGSGAPRKTGGGRATHAGTNYQNRVSAWWAANILTEADAEPPFELPANLTFESLHAETSKAVDDLAVNTSAQGEILCQAKHTVSLGTTSKSALGKTVAQFVRQFRTSTAKLDPAKDRLVLVTASLSSASIKTHLPAFLARLRTSAAPQKEWTAGNKGENQAAAVIRNHIVNTWQAECGKKPTAAEITTLLRLVHVQVLDVDRGGDHEREAKQLLRRSVLTTPADATKCWNTLLAEVGGYATVGQSADRSALQQALTRAGIEVKAPPSYQRDIGRLKDLTTSTLKGLEEFSRIEVGGKAITIGKNIVDTPTFLGHT